MSFAHDVHYACQVSRRVFVMNPNFRRSNFYSQQIRSLALIREMFSRKELVENKSEIIVIGGGITGLTMSAAAITGNVGVTIIEKHAIMHNYSESAHRELHPNLIFWPFQDPRAFTNLPFLYWSCNSARDVAVAIVDQWKSEFENAASFLKDEVVEIKESDTGVSISCSSGLERTADYLLIASGWEKEGFVSKTADDTERTEQIGPSYWTPYGIAEGDVVVSGSGDGGLIDAAYQVFGSKAVAASRTLAYLLHEKRHRKAIQQAEEEAIKHSLQGSIELASRKLDDFYKKLSLEKEDAELIESLCRSIKLNTQLVYRGASPFIPESAPINKTLYSYIMKGSYNVTSIKGELQYDEDGDIILNSESVIKKLDKTKTIVRHGAKPSAYKLLDGAQIKKLENVRPDILAQIVPDSYDEEFYLKNPNRRVSACSKYKSELFYDRSKELIEDMIRNTANIFSIKQHGVNFIRLRGSNTWKIQAREPLRREIRSLFPVKTSQFNVVLTENDPSIFEAFK